MNYLGRAQSEQLRPPPGPAFESLYRLIEQHSEVAAHLANLTRDPYDAEALRAFREALVRACEDPKFDTHLDSAVERARAELFVGVNQYGYVEGTGNTINQAGHDMHIGDVRHFYQTGRGRLILGAAVLVMILTAGVTFAVLINEPSTLEDGSGSGTIAVNAPADTAVSAGPTSARTGSTLVDDGVVDVASNGRVVVYSNQRQGRDTPLSTIDLDTGQVVGRFTLESDRPSGSREIPCDFSVVRVDAKDLVLTFEAEFTARVGTISATLTRRLVARDARTGIRVWTTENQTAPISDSGTTKPWAGCDGAVANKSITSDGKFAWVAFVDNDQPSAVDLRTGRTRSQPGDTLVGNYLLDQIGMLGHSANLINVETGDIVRSVTDTSVIVNVSDSEGRSSPDGNIFVYSGTPFVEGMTAYKVPSLAPLWVVDDLGFDIDVTEKSVVDFSYPGTIKVRSLATGKQLWSNTVAERFCGVTDGTVVLVAGGQVALLNESTGVQRKLYSNIGQCPILHPGIMILGGRIIKL